MEWRDCGGPEETSEYNGQRRFHAACHWNTANFVYESWTVSVWSRCLRRPGLWPGARFGLTAGKINTLITQHLSLNHFWMG